MCHLQKFYKLIECYLANHLCIENISGLSTDPRGKPGLTSSQVEVWPLRTTL